MVLLFLFALSMLGAPACAPQFAPLTTGSYSGTSPVPFWPKAEAGAWGGQWLGWTDDGEQLRAVRLIVRNRRPDEGHDDSFVTVESAPRVTFAVRCVKGLRAGPIQRASSANSIDLLRDRSGRLALGGKQYELRLDSVDPSLADAKVMLTYGGRTQVLYSADGFADDPHFDVAWAGDLDGDGKLDLVVNLSRKYSEHPYRLLLSTKAAPGQLVGDAARFETGD